MLCENRGSAFFLRRISLYGGSASSGYGFAKHVVPELAEAPIYLFLRRIGILRLRRPDLDELLPWRFAGLTCPSRGSHEGVTRESSKKALQNPGDIDINRHSGLNYFLHFLFQREDEWIILHLLGTDRVWFNAQIHFSSCPHQ